MKTTTLGLIVAGALVVPVAAVQAQRGEDYGYERYAPADEDRGSGWLDRRGDFRHHGGERGSYLHRPRGRPASGEAGYRYDSLERDSYTSEARMGYREGGSRFDRRSSRGDGYESRRGPPGYDREGAGSRGAPWGNGPVSRRDRGPGPSYDPSGLSRRESPGPDRPRGIARHRAAGPRRFSREDFQGGGSLFGGRSPSPGGWSGPSRSGGRSDRSPYGHGPRESSRGYGGRSGGHGRGGPPPRGRSYGGYDY